MNWDLLSAGILIVILYLIFFLFRKKFDVDSKVFIIYRTKWGLKLMDRLSKKDNYVSIQITGIILTILSVLLIIFGFIFPNIYMAGAGISLILISLTIAIPWKWIGIAGTYIGFLGMAGILALLIKSFIDIILKPNAMAGVAPLIPGVQIMPGLPILSFWHWIIAILIVATIHEASHGFFARLFKLPIKASGFAFVGPLLAAFVEPDEKKMSKRKHSEQHSILSAGPISNIVTAFIFLAIGTMIITPAVLSGLNFQGVTLTNIDENLPINNTNISEGDIIKTVNGIELLNTSAINNIISTHNPGDILNLTTINGTTHQVELGSSSEDETQPVLGIYISPYYGDIKSGTKIGLWFGELFFWLYIISFGVGLFNLLPMGPVDGGRMFHLVTLKLFKKKKRAIKVWKWVSWAVLILILLNLLPYLFDLIRWIGGG